MKENKQDQQKLGEDVFPFNTPFGVWIAQGT